MKRYETVFIVDPDISDEDRDSLFGKIKDTIPQKGGFLVMFDDWGVRKLAYEIKKKVRGHYIRLDFCGDGALIDELERLFRIDERVIRYMTILLEKKDVDLERLKSELAKTETEAQNTDVEKDKTEPLAVTSEPESHEEEKAYEDDQEEEKATEEFEEGKA